jgi:hypothetical protein
LASFCYESKFKGRPFTFVVEKHGVALERHDAIAARAADYLESAQALERLAAAPSIAPPTQPQQPVQQQQQIQPNKI